MNSIIDRILNCLVGFLGCVGDILGRSNLGEFKAELVPTDSQNVVVDNVHCGTMDQLTVQQRPIC